MPQVIAEYTPERGARPHKAIPIAIIFTDGFSQKDTSYAAVAVRKVIPNFFAVALTKKVHTYADVHK